MEKLQTLEEFYLEKLNWMPENLKKDIGHFNVFKLDDFVGTNAKPIPYSRKDYYKISLIIGGNKVFYADKTIAIKEQALLFASPKIPYSWESTEEKQSGFFCIFTEAFFYQFGNIAEYPMFQPGGNPILELTAEQADIFKEIYLKMFEEINSDYTFKYNAIRNLVFDVIHKALKIQPANTSIYEKSNATTRISSMFMELLERQFPIESLRQKIDLRSPSDFACQLNIHVNHLNKALKQVSGKTTSQLITDRIAQEARALLKHTDWNINEIARCLGFEELSHFINFFKKQVQITPKSFRKR